MLHTIPKRRLSIYLVLAIIATLLTTISNGSPQAPAGHEKFLESITWTSWQRVGNLTWSRKLPIEYRTVVVIVEVHDRNILIGKIEQCLHNDHVAVTLWYLGEASGMQKSCSGFISPVTTPDIWEEEIGYLPDPIERLALIFRKEMFPRKPRAYWNM